MPLRKNKGVFDDHSSTSIFNQSFKNVTRHDKSLSSSFTVDQQYKDDENTLKLKRTSERFAAIEANKYASLPSSARAHLTPDELINIYKDHIKFVMDKKVNTKNAFDCPLIDELQRFADLVVTADGIQEAASSLDASAIIYGYRVDKLHQDTIKMAGSFASSKENGAHNQEMPQCDSSVARSKKKKESTKTIEKNLDNLNIPKSNPSELIHTSFDQILYMFGENTSQINYFVNSLEIMDDSLCFVFNDNDINNEYNEVFDEVYPVAALKEICTKSSFAEADICPTFRNFMFNEHSDDEREIGRNEECNNSHVYIEEMASFNSQTDADNPMDFNHDDPAHISVEFNRDACVVESSKELFSNHQLCDPNELLCMLSSESTDYAFFNQEFDFFHLHKMKKKKIIKGAQNKKKYRQKCGVIIDFSVDEKFVEGFFLCKDPPSTKFKNNEVRAWLNNHLVYPLHRDYVDKCCCLFLRENQKFRRKKTTTINQIFKELGHDDLVDQNGFVEDNYEDAVMFPELSDNLEGDDNMSLLSCPMKLNHLSIKYESTPKPINMRALKDTIWNLFTAGGGNCMVRSFKLSELYELLPFKLKPSESQYLSLPLVVVAVLHLANEHTLTVSNEGVSSENIFFTTKMGDVVITQDL